MIYLIEPNNDINGHNVIYLNSLLSINNTVHLKCKVDVAPCKWSVLAVIKYFFALKKQLMSVPKGNLVHVLYSDIYYKIPFCSSGVLKRNKTVFTMHSCPNGRVKHWLMKNFCKRVERVVVHSENIYNQMKNMGIDNVSYIDYPSFYDYSKVCTKQQLKKKYDIPDDVKVFSALGGIRPDKGLDLLLDSFKYINIESKSKILLNVAGRSYNNFLQESEIRRKCVEYGIKSRLIIRPLSELEFMENVVMSDYMVMPYRGNMTGNSGPMTEAIVNNIPSIVPEESNLGAIAKRYNLGLCFKQDDVEDLSRTIEYALNTTFDRKFEYSEKLKQRDFVLRPLIPQLYVLILFISS